MYKVRIVLLASFLLLTQHAIADTETRDKEVRVGRYTYESLVSEHKQTKLLDVIIKIKFERSVTSVKQAMDYLLLESGYRLSSAAMSDPKINVLYNYSLPSMQREIGPMTLQSALKLLAGTAWTLIVDPVHRLITFELNDNYKYVIDCGDAQC